MTVFQRLLTVVGIVNALMVLWAWTTFRQYREATDRYLQASEVAAGLTASDRFGPAMVEVDRAASWMNTSSAIMERTWNWTALVAAGSVAVVVVYWIFQGKKGRGS